MEKYLAKELIVDEGGEVKIFPLHYIVVDEDFVSFFPFDKERAGFCYCNSISLKKQGGIWKIRQKIN